LVETRAGIFDKKNTQMMKEGWKGASEHVILTPCYIGLRERYQASDAERKLDNAMSTPTMELAWNGCSEKHNWKKSDI
jgi:hypothetical protein